MFAASWPNKLVSVISLQFCSPGWCCGHTWQWLCYCWAKRDSNDLISYPQAQETKYWTLDSASVFLMSNVQWIRHSKRKLPKNNFSKDFLMPPRGSGKQNSQCSSDSFLELSRVIWVSSESKAVPSGSPLPRCSDQMRTLKRKLIHLPRVRINSHCDLNNIKGFKLRN